MKQLITVALDLKRRRVHPEAFQSIQLDISRIFDVSKQTSASCKIAKRSGHLVKWRSLIIRSAAARIDGTNRSNNASSLRVALLQGNWMLTVDKNVLQRPLIFNLLHPSSYRISNDLRNAHLSYGSNEFNATKAN